jgi:hypothetical protein
MSIGNPGPTLSRLLQPNFRCLFTADDEMIC